MEQVYIDVPPRKWGIVVIYDFDVSDESELAAIMESFGMHTRNVNKALNILRNFNTGMAVSKPDLRMSAVFISNATEASEFWSTAIHELIHVADSILEYYGEHWHGESAAYLVGYLTKELVEEIGYPCK